MRAIFGCVVFASLLTTMLPAALAAQDVPPDPRTISVNGTASVNVAPDEIVVHLGVETVDPKLQEARSANDVAARQLVAAIKETGVPEAQIQTSMVQLQLIYPRDSERIHVAGFRALRNYVVTLKDPKMLERVLDAALANGANQLHGIELRSKEQRKHRDEARLMAIRAAREKADALAKELNCTLGPPRSIAETPDLRSFDNNWIGNAARQNNEIGDAGGETTPLGQIAIRSQVSVVFDLVPNQ